LGPRAVSKTIAKVSINDYFDRVYVLNLHHRADRMSQVSARLGAQGIAFERFGGTDGSVMSHVWRSMRNPHFTTPNYLACAISHLSIYRQAEREGLGRVLVVEDDVVLHRDVAGVFAEPPPWEDILYLGWIPLTDDQSMWSYQVADRFVSRGYLLPRNFWGLFAYATTPSLRRELLDAYDAHFPMELDRYFVTRVQPRNRSVALTPQAFACQDVWSDNMGDMQTGMLARSVDGRFASGADYA
jgi:GR25 family glycosyltransferase involved in LPS biosynthesis